MHLLIRVSSMNGVQNKSFLFAIVLITFMGTTSLQADEKAVTGWIEKVHILSDGLLFHAKIDTGADDSSLNAPDWKVTERDNEQWVHFTLKDSDGKLVELDKKLVRMAHIKRKGAADQERPVVNMGLCLGTVYKEVEVNLVDRSSFSYPMLIGRSYLNNQFLVDSSSKYLLKPACIKTSMN